MKKGIILVLSAAFIMLGVFCSFSNSKFSEQETVNLIIATPAGVGLDAGSAKFKELCDKYSNGTIKVDVFSNNLLGDDKIVIEGAQLGDIDIAVASTSPVANMYPDYYIFDAACIFQNTDEVYDVAFKGKTGTLIKEGVETLGLKGLAFWENGFRVLGNNKVPVTTPEQVKGMKIRTMENSLHILAWKALGANPTPMAFTEVFTALQQGTIDGQENSIGQIASNKLYEVQHYISLTNHIYTPYCVVMNLNKWNALTPQQQDIVSRAMNEATEYMLDASQQAEQEAIETMKEYGCEVLDLTPEERMEFQQKILDAGVYDKVKAQMEHPEYFDTLMTELTEFRGDEAL